MKITCIKILSYQRIFSILVNMESVWKLFISILVPLLDSSSQTDRHSHIHIIHRVQEANQVGKEREPNWQTIAVLIHHQLSWNTFLVNAKHSRLKLFMLRCTDFSKYVSFLQRFQNFNIETTWLKEKQDMDFAYKCARELGHLMTEE